MRPRLPHAVRVFFGSTAGIVSALGVLAWLSYTIWIGASKYDTHIEQMIASFLAITFSLLFTFFSWTNSKNQSLDSQIRRAWRVFALAGLCNGIAEALWFYYQSILGIAPFPTLADLFYLLYYPLLLTGVLLLPAAPVNKQEKVVLWLDLSIVMTTAFMGLCYIVLSAHGSKSTLNLEAIVSLAYPVGAMMVIAAAVALVDRDFSRLDFWPLLFLGIGMCFSTPADVLFAYLGLSEREAYLNILWLASAMLLLIAAASQNVHRKISAIEMAPSVRSRSSMRAGLPYLFTIIGIGLLLLVVNSSSAGPRFYAIVFGEMVLVGLVLFRQEVVLRENIRLYQRMQQLANTDPLTSVYNRLYSNDAVRTEIQRAERYGRPFSVLLMDLDDFKKFNDAFGHLQGDEVLKAVALKMNSQLRSTDVLGRFGGDEFIGVLPETDEEGAQATAEKIKEQVSNSSFYGTSIGVTIGIATFMPGQSAEQLVEQADRQLYRQKHEKAQPQSAINARRTRGI